MPLRLTHRDQRAAALILAVLCLSAVYFIGIHWWFTAPLQSIEANMAALRIQHQRYQALEAHRPRLQAQLAQARNTPAGNDSLLPDADAGTATAQLMQWVVAKVQALPPDNGGCTMNNRIPMAVADNAPYRQVKVSVSLDCAIAPLVTLLHGLENQQVALFVETLDIRRNPLAATGTAQRLAVQLQISAYLGNPPDKTLPTRKGAPST
ncbi:type II secretion system protein GspM [Pseudomonas sp. RHF3.3-3]|uniref:type II secretion system protein GspM n=1 Tax=Pseudomonas sp. RHF3.3-3 TaxID=3396624 RepID=UPI003A84FDB1